MAEFDTPTELVDAAAQGPDAGYTKTDAFSPFPLHEIDEALGIKRSILPILDLCRRHHGSAVWASGFSISCMYIDYPIIVGGRPHFSLPAFIPPTYELTILLRRSRRFSECCS